MISCAKGSVSYLEEAKQGTIPFKWGKERYILGSRKGVFFCHEYIDLGFNQEWMVKVHGFWICSVTAVSSPNCRLQVTNWRIFLFLFYIYCHFKEPNIDLQGWTNKTFSFKQHIISVTMITDILQISRYNLNIKFLIISRYFKTSWKWKLDGKDAKKY